MDCKKLLENIDVLCTQKGISRTKAFINSGVGKDFAANIQKGSKPTIDKISNLADYFNVTTDYLLGKDTSTKKNPASDDQIKFALFGTTEVDDDLYEDIKKIAKIQQQLKAEKAKKG